MNKNKNKPVLMFLFVFFFVTYSSVIPGIIQQEIKVAEPYEYTRIYSDARGESHFEDVRIPYKLIGFAPPAPPISVSDSINTEAFVLISSPSGWFGDWHPSPNRQYIFIIAGELDVEVSDGEIRRFEQGNIILVEDTTGKGHISRVVSEKRAYCIAITLGSSQDLEAEQIKEINKVRKERHQAMLSNDFHVLEKYYTEDYTWTSWTGKFRTREDRMDMLRTGQLKYLEHNEDEIQIRIYGDAAIVTGIAITKVMLDGEVRPRRTKRFTEIYVLEDLQWRLTARQATLIEANKSLNRTPSRAPVS